MFKRIRTVIRRTFKTLAAIVAAYLLVLLIGLIPVNNSFTETEDGIEIFVTSNPVHADLILPVETDAVNWRDHFPADCFLRDTSSATHIMIGWGDKGFFIETPTWSDLKASTAVKALLWRSDACLHVTMTNRKYISAGARSVKISSEQYADLCKYIQASIRQTGGQSIPIEDAHYQKSDAFFEAHGTYHCVSTCNTWINKALKSAGVRTGLLLPMPKTVLWYLPAKQP